MLELEDVSFQGHHLPLLQDRNLILPQGATDQTVAATSEARTALALICSGRLSPDGGRVLFQGEDDPRRLRRSTALVDSPGITSPEHHMSVRDLVAESLGLIPGGPGKRIPPAAAWISEQDADDIADSPAVALPAALRLWLITELAFADPGVELAVLDSPDRHGLAPAELSELLQLVSGPDGRTVLAVVSAEVLR